jgi:competence protein ComEC
MRKINRNNVRELQQLILMLLWDQYRVMKMLRVHFLNVGHGDCTIIKHHSGRLTMIDINNSQDYDDSSFKELLAEETQRGDRFGSALWGGTRTGIANALLALSHPPQNPLAIYGRALAQAKRELTNPIDFLRRNYPHQRIWRFILTHPDLDHMSGLKSIYENIGFDNFWDTNHTKPAPDFRSEEDEVDWEFYQVLRTGRVGPNPRFYTRKDSLFAFGMDEYGLPGGDNIEILSPTPQLVSACNKAGRSNSLSYVLRVSHAGKSVLLAGDAEDDAWENITSFYGNALKSHFLKASHHGRDSGYNIRAVRLISPLITFVSVGRKPDTDASSKYRQQSSRVASTRYHGNIELQIYDNGQHKWFVDRNPKG